MADHNHGDGHGPALFNLYMIVAGALAVCTISSFFFNWLARSHTITHTQSFLLILAVAIVKATLVGMYFMHLKWDWRLLYFFLVPAFILATMMVIVLLPDSVIGTTRDEAEAIEISKKAP